MAFKVFIPARYASSRFPGKPLINLAGKTMIQRVYEQAQKSRADAVYVATDDERIREAVQAFGGEAIMTRAYHETGTDRIREATSAVGLAADDIVVNVQGDEPLMPSQAINQVALGIDGQVRMSTLKEPLMDMTDVMNPNVVKVVVDADDVALYFSRAPVPWSRDDFGDENLGTLPAAAWFRHLGVYAYTVGMLEHYVSWPASQLEQLEKLEQLRVLANGEKIRVLTCDAEIPPGIDVPEDVPRTLARLGAEGKPT